MHPQHPTNRLTSPAQMCNLCKGIPRFKPQTHGTIGKRRQGPSPESRAPTFAFPIMPTFLHESQSFKVNFYNNDPV
jgi:hypothetical protein